MVTHAVGAVQDIKPENLYLDEGDFRIGDFGIAISRFAQASGPSSSAGHMPACQRALVCAVWQRLASRASQGLASASQAPLPAQAQGCATASRHIEPEPQSLTPDC